MDEYPGNSIVQEPRERRAVISGKVIQRKTPILDQVVKGETSKAIFDYVVWDVLVPAAKNTVSEIVKQAIDMALYGPDTKRRSGLRRDRERTYVSYGDYFSERGGSRSEVRQREREDRVQPTRRQDRRHNFEELVLESRGDAEEVLSTLVEMIDQYEVATVADFYDAVGLGSLYTDRKYGWDSLAQASVRPVRGGFILDLPRPVQLD